MQISLVNIEKYSIKINKSMITTASMIHMNCYDCFCEADHIPGCMQPH